MTAYAPIVMHKPCGLVSSLREVDPEFGHHGCPGNTRLSDLELLRIEVDLMWDREAAPELVLACARGGLRARISTRVRPEVARTLVRASWTPGGGACSGGYRAPAC